MPNPIIPANDIPSSVHVWIQRAESKLNSFAISLGNQLTSKGGLTQGQVDAVIRAADRDRQYELEVSQRQASAPAADVGPVVECLQKAVDNGLKAPKIRLGKYRFSLAKPDSKNPGAIYVKDKGGEYLGKIQMGRLQLMPRYRDQEEEVLKVTADPVNQAIAYGKEYGVCALCGRDLSDPISVERGIGPICAERFGF